MRITTISIMTLCLAMLVLPAYASQPFHIGYRIKDSGQGELGYRTTLSITVYNHTAQSYQNITLLPENIHILSTASSANEIHINNIPANNFIRHHWTVESVIAFDEFADNSLYFHIQATDSSGQQVAFPVLAVRE